MSERKSPRSAARESEVYKEIINEKNATIADLKRQLKEANDDRDMYKNVYYVSALQQIRSDYDKALSELAQLRRDLKACKEDSKDANNDFLEVCDERDTLRAEVETYEKSLQEIYEALDGLPITGDRATAKSVKYLDAPEQIKALRAEVERLKRVNDEYGVEEVGKLVDRVQELEEAMQSVLAESRERYQCSRCEYIEQIAKHALDGDSI